MAAEPASAPGWEEHRPNARLAGRRILVTGAGAGIGRCTAGLFRAEGAAVALLDRDAAAVEAAAAACGGAPVVADVTDAVAVDRAVASAAAALGGLDDLVNCAGISRPGRVEEVDIAAFRQVIEVNLIGAHAVIRACLPHLRAAPWATIVNLASGQGLVPAGPSNAAYAASKGGLITLTRSLAQEFAPLIRVNSVCPGMVPTGMTAGRSGDGRQYALKRNATPLEVAQAILFLAGTDSAFVTGIALPVDGGRTFH
ncbi:SDR family NAD(P)-dependent oxidoreductase [Paracraurococcus lichenis]|uniref:SDR family oxidoreductase n=1 Tax=Paracraurococcus lichenis TaxID=3064888 RepID=A0ABT9E8Z9_9PROT|nr:SDR family oxidoreductase [Paracraurococcus sp. LOR1-02]MDO9712676.1 SDR family oxidoreductase [Paracraurococcus sp. LOR1-02]